MSEAKNNYPYFRFCAECNGSGKKRRRLRKKVKLRYQIELALFKKKMGEGVAPVRPQGHLDVCANCSGSGLIPSSLLLEMDPINFPNLAIVGGGIGGVALAVACFHRGIPFTLYERDSSFNDRSQGYGLTLQQASKAMHGFGIPTLSDGIVSTRHVVHTTNGKIIGEWGMRKWLETTTQNENRRSNIHIARQALRLALINQLGENNSIQWGHKLVDFKEIENNGIELIFEVNGEKKCTTADLLVGADGIRSSVRERLIGEKATPLRYLDCIVILGICPLSALKGVESELLDSATVFQTANGNERIYMMPFDKDSIMWQLSFPMQETEARLLSSQGAAALKKEALKRTPWHTPIPEILAATAESQISGYPVYDRALLSDEILNSSKNVTLIGDAAHPMSPFKGQGANQALLDALSLARGIFKGCKPFSNWREIGLRNAVLTDFEAEMIERSATKVKDSADAAQFLHTEVALYEGNEPRGKVLKRKEGR